ncbi:MAG: hypothetical protein ACREN6_00145 [Gemmatimonadaceae bacterium]
MEGAFDLIGAVAPQILARIHRDVKRIMLVDAGGPEFWPLARGFILNTAFVEGSDIEFIALTIVHEATHARLWHAGFRYHERLRGRIERICVGAERAFAMRLPDAEYFVAYSEEKLASPWWAASQVEARQARARAKLWPGWLFRARQRVVSWRRRSAAPPERCLGDSHDAL